ncbi:putative hscarg dehydrogenase [Neohortaea acidophila]|uniref:Putative hscarg dehydrogenase n=1 Tax=Neohortaea acidophila TaxID=245834 RepID=A0A6A6PVG7_9PEZI|nr:putative hscarg dehydrogenase [Neohortaea acidophila]KAF2483724.1 putative hscarg dehydrogenase [Neohortaea acidophila]
MAKTLAVFGATGQQGSSIIQSVLNDAELSQQYLIRAITRDVDAAKAKHKQLQSKVVEVVAADSSDRGSLEKALTGVDTAFVMTTPSFTPDGEEVEFSAGRTIVDVAVEQGVGYIIFSTLPSPRELSGGKYTKCIHFESKARLEKYIRGLHPKVKSAFISPGAFMSNFQNMPFLGPQKAADGKSWVSTGPNSPKTPIPLIDHGDMGKYVGAILAEPDKYEGKTFCASTKMYTRQEAADIVSKATGKKVVYKQLPPEQWASSLPFAQDILLETFSYVEEFGYYGPRSEELVKWAAENARGKVTTFEEYLAANPLLLN